MLRDPYGMLRDPYGMLRDPYGMLRERALHPHAARTPASTRFWAWGDRVLRGSGCGYQM
jgi:hypothetical protein